MKAFLDDAKNKGLTIKMRIYIISAVLILVVMLSTGIVISSLNAAKDDADNLNALGRQRMLTQAMGKSAFGYNALKGKVISLNNQVSTLNSYITQMRTLYTKMVIPTAKKTGLKISMNPESESKPAVPFPATLTRMVNESFGMHQDDSASKMSIDILSRLPVNPVKGLISDHDKKADEFLRQNGDKLYSATQEKDGKLFLLLYASDIATVGVCASCHSAISGKNFKVGDMLGIRKFRLLFSDDIAAGYKQLNPSLDEYNTAKEIFGKTLAAMKFGGKYPADLKITKFKTVSAIDNVMAQEKIVEIENKFAQFTATIDKVLNAKAGVGSSTDQSDILTQSNQLRKLSNDLVTIYTGLANKNQSNILWAVIISGLVIILVALIMAYYFKVTIINPINDTTAALRDISEGEGDLTARLNVKSGDEIGQMAKWLDTFIENIAGIIVKVLNTATQVSTSTSEISATVEEQSAIASQQSSSITEVTATMEELSASSSQIADNATAVAEQSTEALTLAEKGADSLRDLREKISEVNVDNQTNIKEIIELGQKSKEIGKVMDIINSIADQTKLIAFNAAIEASSAGEAGKRFSVVAVEIRRLADNVMESTGDIAGKIEEIQGSINRLVIKSEKGSAKVEKSNESVSETLDELLNIVAGAKYTNDSATQISLATQQQKTATNQALIALKEVDTGIRQYSISIKQTSETIVGLKELATELNTLVGKFKVNGAS